LRLRPELSVRDEPEGQERGEQSPSGWGCEVADGRAVEVI
jgi:hypothetical protein